MAKITRRFLDYDEANHSVLFHHPAQNVLDHEDLNYSSRMRHENRIYTLF